MKSERYVRKRSAIILALWIVGVSACRQPPVVPVNELPPLPPLSQSASGFTSGVYVMNEGLFQRNNAAMTYYSFIDSSATTDFFSLINSRALGDTGSDLLAIGDKLYAAVNVSSAVLVLTLDSAVLLKTIPLFDGGRAREPVRLAFAAGKIFATCFRDASVAVIDTSTFQVQTFIAVGNNPEGVAAVGNKIYVANSGGLNPNNLGTRFDSTISIIDAVTLKETKRITVWSNPRFLDTDAKGNVYVSASGDYGYFPPQSVPPRLIRVSGDTLSEVYAFATSEVAQNGIEVFGDSAFVPAPDGGVMLVRLSTGAVLNPAFIASAAFQRLYALSRDARTGDLYTMDAKNYTTTGTVRVYSRSGVFKFKFDTGLNPSGLAFRRRP